MRGTPEGLDTDAFDADCAHMLVEDTSDGAVVCCFRLMHLPSGAQIGRSYSAQFYELSALRPTTRRWSRWAVSASTRTGRTPISCVSHGPR
jgi:putative hemolysin